MDSLVRQARALTVHRAVGDHGNRLTRDLVQIETADRRLLEAVSLAMTDAVRRSGEWVVCKPGCAECCLGPFGITQLDALRLRKGLALLEAADPHRAKRVRARAEAFIAAIAPEYPGDPITGELLDEEKLPNSMDDTPCPALDPDTHRCDLYEARPITCRTFGPATRSEDSSVSTCELCYTGASDEEIRRCAVKVDTDGLERKLLEQLESTGRHGMTIVAFALAADGRGR